MRASKAKLDNNSIISLGVYKALNKTNKDK